MSEDQTSANASAPETPESAPRVRRISNPRPKKTAAKTARKSDVPPQAEVSVPAPVPPPAKDQGDAPSASTVTEAQASQDWPDAETVSDASAKGGADKRKRRRRKGKGGQNSQGSAAAAEETISLAEGVPAATEGGATLPAPVAQTSTAPQQPSQHQQRPPQQQPQHNNQNQHQHRQPVSPELVAKRAWKIYLAEVSEEGVSLISDQDARELSKRCFRLAELFLEEQGRRLR